jgi:hypothetical protein
MWPTIPTVIAIGNGILLQAVATARGSRSLAAWRSISATVRLIATLVGIAHEPRYVVVRIHSHADEVALVSGDRAA